MLSIIIKLAVKYGKKVARKALADKKGDKKTRLVENKIVQDQTYLAVLIILNLVLVCAVVAVLLKK